MSKPIPSDKILELYTDFNDLYKEIMDKPFKDLKSGCETIWTRFRPKGEAIQNADFSSSTLLSKAQTIQDIDHKLESVRAKLFGSSKKLDLWSPSHKVLEGCVGYRNASNNCWLNALLEMCQQRPHLWDTVTRVGTFCQEGGNIDLHRMQQVLHAFETGTPEDLTEVLSAYNGINHLIYKLNIIYRLKNKKVDPNILSRFPFPIDAYRERIREKMQKMLAITDKATQKLAAVWAEMAIEEILQEDLTPTIEQMKIDGGFLLQALVAYEEGTKLEKSIPTSVSQNAREAFHRLFRNYTPDGRVNHPISISASNNEDSHEAIENLMGLDERIRVFRGTYILPQGYFSVQKTSVFTPLLSTPPTVDTSGRFTTLEHNSFLTKSTQEHEIILNLQEGVELSLEELLSRQACRRESHEARYINPAGMLQKYLCKESRTRIQGTPDQLTFQLVRFNGQMQKNRTPVLINRYMILPEEAIIPPQIAVYQLESFIVHTGASKSTGHYISYRKVNGNWIEFDDARLNYKTDAQIDDILHQRKQRSNTPYLIYYSKVPDSKQEAMLKIAKSLAQKVTGQTKIDPTTFRDQEVLVTRLDALNESLKDDQNKTKTRELYESFIKEYPVCAQHMHRLVDLLLGIPEQLCGEDPTHLKATVAGETIPENTLKYEMLKLKRLDAELSLQAFKRFYQHLFSTEKDFEKVFSNLPLPLQNQIRDIVAPGEELGKKFEEASKYGNLRDFILQSLDKEHDLSIIEHTLQQQIQHEVQIDILHLEDFLVLLRSPKLDKNLLSNLLKSFHLLQTTYEQLLHGINMRRSGKLMKTRQDRDLNVLSLTTNPTMLLQPRSPIGKPVPTNTLSILEYTIINLRK